jgi:putative sigma-54 modulation protein
VQIKISTRHGHLSDDSRRYIEDKAQKLLQFFQRLTMIEVMVDLKEQEKLVEFVVLAEHKHEFVAHERNADLLAAIDLVLEKLEKQITRYKEKIQDRRRTPSAGEVAGAPPLAESDEE